MHFVKGSDAKASQSTENRTSLSCFSGLVTKGGNLRSIRVVCESSRGTVQNAVAAQLRRAAGRQPSVDDYPLQPNARRTPAWDAETQRAENLRGFRDNPCRSVRHKSAGWILMSKIPATGRNAHFAPASSPDCPQPTATLDIRPF